MADRGELENFSVESLVNGLHIRISNTAPYRSEMKAIIESSFHTTQARVRPLLPAMVDQDAKMRGDRDKN